ncbi:MAG: hypothetical protein HY550_04820 [Elusimicrobia bacterium]|nr:hypothetical protein [Elusimicrobiota bacterium]
MKIFLSVPAILLALVPGAFAETRVSFDQKGGLPALVESLKAPSETQAAAVPRTPKAGDAGLADFVWYIDHSAAVRGPF